VTSISAKQGSAKAIRTASNTVANGMGTGKDIADAIGKSHRGKTFINALEKIAHSGGLTPCKVRKSNGNEDKGYQFVGVK
jgi:hypothetical protein